MNCKSRYPKLEELHAAFPDYMILLRGMSWSFIRRGGRSFRLLVSKKLAVNSVLGWKGYIEFEIENAQVKRGMVDISTCKQTHTNDNQRGENEKSIDDCSSIIGT